jgi:hypothetical protein
MIPATLSSEYLQSIPVQKKKEQIKSIIDSFVGNLHHAASVGQTSFTFDPSHLIQAANTAANSYKMSLQQDLSGARLDASGDTVDMSGVRVDAALKQQQLGLMQKNVNFTSLPCSPLTVDDLISEFKLKFPNCRVSFKETWVDVNKTTKTLKSGIVIDWSVNTDVPKNADAPKNNAT